MTTPSTAEYQRYRTSTLRGIGHTKVLKVARDLMKTNQKNGHRYARKTKQALRGHA